jgi:dUTP pyrophosphatase
MNFILEFLYNFIDRATYFKVNLLNVYAKTPKKADIGSAGYDLYSVDDIAIEAHERRLVSTGISVEIPRYYYLRVAPRSGLSVKGIDVGAGVIDSSYRGEVKVLLINNSDKVYFVQQGDRVAQLIMERCSNTNIVVSDEQLSATERGESGFGSTGL